jgi:membrane dipeptidase
MLVVDAHCDTASVLLDQNAGFYENGFQVDLKRLLASGERVQFLASFSNPLSYGNNPLVRVLKIMDYIYAAQSEYPDKIAVCKSSLDIENAISSGKVAALLSIEGGDALCGELSILRQLYRLGVRSLILTWNYRNLLADGSLEVYGGGLSNFGRQVVAEMNRLGMVVDVSHLCEKSFYDVLATSSATVIASHSNARDVCSHKRNLSDKQLLELKRNGGVVGVTFYPYFLNNTPNASIEDVLRHIEHICSVVGEEHIGIGTDFDGIECVPAGLEGTQCLDGLFNRLLALNYTESAVQKLAGLNFMRILRNVLK